jgi:hypothetical protein
LKKLNAKPSQLELEMAVVADAVGLVVAVVATAAAAGLADVLRGNIVELGLAAEAYYISEERKLV